MRALLTRSPAPVTFLIASSPLLLPGLIGESFTYDKVSIKAFGLWEVKGLTIDEAFRRKRDIEHWVANRSWFDILRFLGRQDAKTDL